MQQVLTGCEVMKANREHVQMMVDDQIVLMREEDCTINATQLLKLSKKTISQQRKILDILRENSKGVFRPAQGTHGRKNTWVSLQSGEELCVELGLAEKLRPLLQHGLDLQLNRSNTGSEKVCDR